MHARHFILGTQTDHGKLPMDDKIPPNGVQSGLGLFNHLFNFWDLLMVSGTSYLVFRLIIDKHCIMIVQILPHQHDVLYFWDRSLNFLV